MDYGAELPSGSVVRAGLLDKLRQRLESANRLALDFHEHLGQADTEKIETGVARLHSTAEEFRVLLDELHRLPPASPDAEAHPRMREARAALESTVSQVARSSAVTGGLLARMVAVTRGRLSLFSAATDGTYAESGKASPLKPRGVRLKEWG